MTNETSHDARAVANLMLKKSRVHNKGIDSLSVPELLKLVYFAHGWSLAFSDVPLVKQLPEVWPYGPVYLDVYYSLREWLTLPIETLIINAKTKLPYLAIFSKFQERVIDFVLEKYGKVNVFDLSDKTHSLGTPWEISLKRHGLHSAVSNDLMRKHYRAQAKKEGITL